MGSLLAGQSAIIGSVLRGFRSLCHRDTCLNAIDQILFYFILFQFPSGKSLDMHNVS